MDTTFSVDTFVPLNKYYLRYMTEKTKDNKIASSYIPFLKALSSQSFNSQHDLSQYLCCNKAHTSRTLLKMQLAGLVCPTCFRNKIELTEKGKKTADKIAKYENLFIQQLFSTTTDKELVTFNKVIEKLLKNAQSDALQTKITSEEE